MAQTTYTYLLTAFTSSGGVVNNTAFKAEIAASAIAETCDWINTDATNCDIVFANALSTGDVTVLDGLVAAHGGLALYDAERANTYLDFLLENDPPSPATVYSYTVAGGQVTQEKWLRGDTSKLKTIDYTYSGGKVATEDRKVYATNGTLVLAQKTGIYTWLSGQASIAWTRYV